MEIFYTVWKKMEKSSKKTIVVKIVNKGEIMKRKKVLKGLSIAILGVTSAVTLACVGIALHYKLTHKEYTADEILHTM